MFTDFMSNLWGHYHIHGPWNNSQKFLLSDRKLICQNNSVYLSFTYLHASTCQWRKVTIKKKAIKNSSHIIQAKNNRNSNWDEYSWVDLYIRKKSSYLSFVKFKWRRRGKQTENSFVIWLEIYIYRADLVRKNDFFLNRSIYDR